MPAASARPWPRSGERPANAPRSGGNKPNVVGPPAPDPDTSSGAPAAATPVAVAGHRRDSGAVTAPDPSIAVGPDESPRGRQQPASRSAIGRATASTSVTSGSLPTFFDLPESAATRPSRPIPEVTVRRCPPALDRDRAELGLPDASPPVLPGHVSATDTSTSRSPTRPDPLGHLDLRPPSSGRTTLPDPTDRRHLDRQARPDHQPVRDGPGRQRHDARLRQRRPARFRVRGRRLDRACAPAFAAIHSHYAAAAFAALTRCGSPSSSRPSTPTCG